MFFSGQYRKFCFFALEWPSVIFYPVLGIRISTFHVSVIKMCCVFCTPKFISTLAIVLSVWLWEAPFYRPQSCSSLIRSYLFQGFFLITNQRKIFKWCWLFINKDLEASSSVRSIHSIIHTGSKSYAGH